MNITIIGSGYVGLVTGTCFAEMGNNVICVDNNKEKIQTLKQGKVPIYEPGLKEMIQLNVKRKRLTFSLSIKTAIKKSTVVFICVPTPSREDGNPDLSYVENVAKEIALSMTGYLLIISKSTVPVETSEKIKEVIKINRSKKIKFDVASNPEFLKEGTAIQDFMYPDRIVIGVESKKSRDILEKLYAPLNAPIIITDVKSAEIIKHASNSFLAMKISFINAVANICAKVGADVLKVAEGMGTDKRIGKDFLNAGIGYGGSCFPKDVDAFIATAKKHGYDFSLLKEAKYVNEKQKKIFIKIIENTLWNLSNKTIAVLGLSFKPNTDDMRNAPSIDVIKFLQDAGAKIKVFDPQAMNKAKEILTGVSYCRDVYSAAKNSDCVVIMTEWNEFRELDFIKLKKALKQPVIIDGRNIYAPDLMAKLGFKYVSIGR